MQRKWEWGSSVLPLPTDAIAQGEEGKIGGDDGCGVLEDGAGNNFLNDVLLLST